MAGGSGSGSGSGSGGSGGSGGGGGSVYYAEQAGHADTADEATHAGSADSATEATHATSADTATSAGHATSAANLDNDSTDWLKIARKDIAQAIAEVWTFAKGIVSTLRSYFNGGVTVSKAQGDTDKALIVTGGVKADTIDATSASMETLTVTKEAHFFKLVVDELLSNKGAIIISSANCVAERVATYSNYYKIYFAATDKDGNAVANPWKVGDLALCLTFKAEGAGTFDDVRNRYYWRKVLHIGNDETIDGVTYHVIRLSNASGEYDGSTTPAVGDNIVQLGYVGNDAAYRQSAVILSAYPTMDAGVTPPSLAFYKGINDFNLSNHRYTFIDGINNDFVGNFSVIVNGTKTDITTLFATAAGLQAEVTNRTNADQALANGYSQLKMSWNKISQSVFSLVNVANKETFTQSDTSTEWASDMNGNATVFNGTFSTYRPVEIVTSFGYDYTNYPSQGGQAIIVFGFINGASTRSFEVAVIIGSDGQATIQKNIGGANVDADVTVDETTGHVNVFVRNSGNEITAAEVHISPRWGVITIENIIVADTDESHSFKRTGIDVMQGVIDLIADKVNFKNADGTVSGKVSIDAVKGTLITQDAVLRGNLFLPYTRITQDNWSDYGTYNSSVGTTYNLLGEIAGKTAAGLNLQVEYIQTPSDVTNLGHVRLPDLTDKDPDSWVGCEVNILNDTTTNPLYVRGTPNGNNFGLTKWERDGWNAPNHNVGINPGCEGKFKLIKTSVNGSSTAYYLWICCYANLNQ